MVSNINNLRGSETPQLKDNRSATKASLRMSERPSSKAQQAPAGQNERPQSAIKGSSSIRREASSEQRPESSIRGSSTLRPEVRPESAFRRQQRPHSARKGPSAFRNEEEWEEEFEEEERPQSAIKVSRRANRDAAKHSNNPFSKLVAAGDLPQRNNPFARKEASCGVHYDDTFEPPRGNAVGLTRSYTSAKPKSSAYELTPTTGALVQRAQTVSTRPGSSSNNQQLTTRPQSNAIMQPITSRMQDLCKAPGVVSQGSATVVNNITIINVNRNNRGGSSRDSDDDCDRYNIQTDAASIFTAADNRDSEDYWNERRSCAQSEVDDAKEQLYSYMHSTKISTRYL